MAPFWVNGRPQVTVTTYVTLLKEEFTSKDI